MRAGGEVVWVQERARGCALGVLAHFQHDGGRDLGLRVQDEARVRTFPHQRGLPEDGQLQDQEPYRDPQLSWPEGTIQPKPDQESRISPCGPAEHTAAEGCSSGRVESPCLGAGRGGCEVGTEETRPNGESELGERMGGACKGSGAAPRRC